jgi:hypothetical protein
MNHPKRKHCYTISFKHAVIQYAKEHGNRAAERQFGLLPTDGTEHNLLFEDSDDLVPDSEEL